MGFPDYDDPKPIFCERCGEEIVEDIINVDPYGDPYCEKCREEVADDDDWHWRLKYRNEYLDDVETAAYELWCDMQTDIALGK